MDFINDSELLVTEKKGRIFQVNISDGSSIQIQNEVYIRLVKKITQTKLSANNWIECFNNAK